MNRASQVVNAGEMTVVRLERAEYMTTDDISGTVELSNYRNKEITSVILEISTWRHISPPNKTDNAKKPCVEQLYRQTLELFPNVAEGTRLGHDEKTLRNNAMFSFTFSATTTKPPTVDFLEHGRIKHYITCYVYKKSGLLARERLIEKNQFQIAVKDPKLEVDALFPDRTFSCLESRPHSSNPAKLDFRCRCNRHLLPGLPFLLEIDTAQAIEVKTITISLHQRIYTAIAGDEIEHSYEALYVHQFNHPRPGIEGHFRDRDSAKPLAYGRRSYLLEWHCPDGKSQHRLPFRQTIYSKTDQGTIEVGLSIKIEVDLMNGAKLAAVIHNLNYCPVWVDARHDQSASLRLERSTQKPGSRPGSLQSGSRRGSFASSIGTPSVIANHLSQNQYHSSTINGMRQGSIPATLVSRNTAGSYRPAVSPQDHPYRVNSEVYSPASTLSRGYPIQDYFTDSRSHPTPQSAQFLPEVSLGNGSYSPFDVNLSRLGRSRSNTQQSTSVATAALKPKKRPDQIMLPPAEVRSSMTAAFESMQINSAESHPQKPYIDMPTPPPSHPPPAAPDGYNFNHNHTLFSRTSPMFGSGQFSVQTDDARSSSSQSTRRTPKLSRPPVVLGISQETVQTRHVIHPKHEQDHVYVRAYDVKQNGNSDAHHPRSTILTSQPENTFDAPVSSSGFARRKADLPPAESLNQDGGQVVLG